jgi:tripartite motif-containing protein 71
VALIAGLPGSGTEFDTGNPARRFPDGTRSRRGENEAAMDDERFDQREGDGAAMTRRSLVGAAVGVVATALAAADGAGKKKKKKKKRKQYTFVTKWGKKDYLNGDFSDPQDVAVSDDGAVYVADALNHRIQVFSNDGQFQDKWGGQGSGNGQFSFPEGIGIDADGNVFVADTNLSQRIQKFDAAGDFVTTWGNDTVFDGPQDVAIAANGNVYVVNTFSDRVLVFAPNAQDPKQYDPVTDWGGSGSGNGAFSLPNGVAVDRQGNVFVADTFNHRIQKFGPAGEFKGAWGSQGGGTGQFREPTRLAVDADGNVFVADRNNHRIQKFTGSGKFLAAWGSQGSGDGQFSFPEGVAVDGKGNVFVADTGNDRIQKFALK